MDQENRTGASAFPIGDSTGHQLQSESHPLLHSIDDALEKAEKLERPILVILGS